MAIHDNLFIRAFYSGTPGEKLAVATTLFARLTGNLAAIPLLPFELEQLQCKAVALNQHMQRAMDLGQFCAHCAAQPGGCCCSALMADNTDAIQIVINLFLKSSVIQQPDSGENCCFLGPQGCLFIVKPIFCLNYNCSHILDKAEPAQLVVLYQLAAAVLSQQTTIEGLVLEALRKINDLEKGT